MSFTAEDMAAAVVNIAKGVVRPDILNQFYSTIKHESYDYDYLIQNELIALQTFDMTLKNTDYKYIYGLTGDRIVAGNRVDANLNTVGTSTAADQAYYPYSLSKQVMYTQFPYELVETAVREKYRRSEYFGKDVSYMTLKTATEYYRTMPLVFINDKIITDFDVQVKDDFTELHLDFGTYIKATKTANLPVVVASIPDTVVATNKVDLTASITTGRTFNSSLLDSTDGLADSTGFFGWFVPKDDANPAVFIPELTYDSSVGTFVIGGTSQIPTISLYNLVVVGFKNFKQYNAYTTSDTYFALPLEDMAIPKSNLLIVVQNADGVGAHINRNDEITITEYYPNIYQITNNINRPFYVYALYCDNPSNELMQYDTELDYYLSKVNLLDRYKANTVPTILKEYKPITWNYLISDYHDSAYYWEDNMTVTTNPAWGGLLYKLSKIQGWFKRWCAFFQEYIAETYNFMSNWELTITSADITNRLRYDTSDVLPSTHEQSTTFAGGAYLFIYNNNDALQRPVPYSWWIDNCFKVPILRVVYGGLEFVYFDIADLKEGSIMDIERYDGANFEHMMTIDSGTEYSMSFLNTPMVAKTIWFTDAQGYYLPRNTYTITVKNKEFGDYELPDDSAYLILPTDIVTFTPISTTYDHTTIQICGNNRASSFGTYTDPDKDPIDQINLNKDRDIPMTQQDYLTRLRIFSSDGRFMPRTSYIIRTQDNVANLPSFTVAARSLKAQLNIQYTGCDDRLVYHLDELPANGFLDLEGLLTRPFSLAYHDVFVNGFKLNASQIEIIGPYHIAIQNVETRRHFEIYETSYPAELFTYSSGESSQYIADMLYMQDSTFQQAVQDALVDIIENPNIPDIEDLVDWMGQFISDWLMDHFVNADKWYTGGSPDYFDQWEQIFADTRRLLRADNRADSSIDEGFTYYMNHDLSKVKIWNHLQEYVRDGTITNLMRVGNQITTEKLTSTQASIGANNIGVTGVGLVEETFINKMDVAVGDYLFTYSLENSAWVYSGSVVKLNEYGITFTGTPKDGDTINVHEYTDTLVFEIVDFDHDEIEDSTYTHSMTLRQLKSDLRMGYCSKPAMYYAENGLAAGTYTVAVSNTVKTAYASWYGSPNITFTLGTAIPAKGQIVLEWAGGNAITTASIKTYADQLSTIVLESTTCAAGTTGTSLGTMDGNTTNLNYDMKIINGVENYENSQIAAYLNGTSYGWWIGNTYIFTRPPTNVNEPGYLYGFPKDFLSSIGKTIHKSNNTGSDGTAYNVFIPSRSEMWMESSTANGTPYALFKDNSVSATATTATDPIRIYYNSDNVAVYWKLRLTNNGFISVDINPFGESYSSSGSISTQVIVPFINII